jgi:hypothetical protein
MNTVKAIVLPNHRVFQVDGEFSMVTDRCDDLAKARTSWGKRGSIIAMSEQREYTLVYIGKHVAGCSIYLLLWRQRTVKLEDLGESRLGKFSITEPHLCTLQWESALSRTLRANPSPCPTTNERSNIYEAIDVPIKENTNRRIRTKTRRSLNLLHPIQQDQDLPLTASGKIDTRSSDLL